MQFARLFVPFAFVVMLFVPAAVGQEIIHTTTSANTVASKSTIEVPALSGNPQAIIIATPIGNTAALDPHPIGAWYYNGKWNVFNTDHANMPIGLSFRVQVFPGPDADHFLHVVNKSNLLEVGSYIDHSALNGNPNAQFTIFQNHSPDARPYNLNPNEAQAVYDPAAGRWYIANVNGKRLSPNTTYSVVVNAVPGKVTTASRAIPGLTRPSEPGTTLFPTLVQGPVKTSESVTSGAPRPSPGPSRSNGTVTSRLPQAQPNPIKLGDDRVAAPSADVGTPEGKKVTKGIGPGGGTLSSPDGRWTITIPKNALSETIKFGIEPLPNKLAVGIGPAYKLEPEGTKFTTPLEITVKYEDRDLEGTFPEALALAFQDEKGAWRLPIATKLDKARKTLTVSTTHFSLWSFLTSLKITPAKATIRVGQSINLEYTSCFALPAFIEPASECLTGLKDGDGSALDGPGELSASGYRLIYTAPAKKPSPNVATVTVTTSEAPCKSYGVPECRELESKSVKAVITIVDRRGYRADGTYGSTKFSGVICDIDKPFTVNTSNAFLPAWKFEPTFSDGGNWSFPYVGVSGAGGGTYRLEGPGDARTGIALNGSATVVAPVAGTASGLLQIRLTPLGPDDPCDDK